jgi:transposase
VAPHLADPAHGGQGAGRQRGLAHGGIVDSQSVKTTESGGPAGVACPRASRRLDPGDAAKKIKGRKRHLVTDTLGLPLVLAIHPADLQDRDGLGLVCHRIKPWFPWLSCLFADAGYQGDIAAGIAAQAGLRLAIVKRVRAKGFVLLPKRWAIERTFAWLGRNRRLTKDFERLIEASTAMVAVAIIQLLARRLATN